MTPEELVQEVLDRGLEVIQAQAVQFAKDQGAALSAIKPAQWYSLKEILATAASGASLFEEIKKFLEHQQQRGERVGTTPWEKLAGPLISLLQSLPQVLHRDLLTSLQDLARQGQNQGRLDPSLAYALEMYCQGANFNSDRQDQWQFACLRGFLLGLFRLMRGKDIQKDHSAFFKCLE